MDEQLERIAAHLMPVFIREEQKMVDGTSVMLPSMSFDSRMARAARQAVDAADALIVAMEKRGVRAHAQVPR